MIHCVAEMAIVGRQSKSEEDVPPEYHIPQSTYHNKVAYLGIEFFCAPILTIHPTVVFYYSNLN